MHKYYKPNTSRDELQEKRGSSAQQEMFQENSLRGRDKSEFGLD